jgi:hypothetical protein
VPISYSLFTPNINHVSGDGRTKLVSPFRNRSANCAVRTTDVDKKHVAPRSLARVTLKSSAPGWLKPIGKEPHSSSRISSAIGNNQDSREAAEVDRSISGGLERIQERGIGVGDAYGKMLMILPASHSRRVESKPQAKWFLRRRSRNRELC